MISKSPIENFDDGYYHFRKDLQEYPRAGIYVVRSRRCSGKTYSFHRHRVDEENFDIYDR